MTSHYPVPQSFLSNAFLDKQRYETLYQQATLSPETFWAEQAEQFIDWQTPWESVLQGDFSDGRIKWFSGATLNVSYNCIDRHLPQHANRTAFIWENNEGDTCKTISYQDLHDHVCRLANALTSLGVAKGDRVCIYMPMIPEAAFAMLACARIGAVHSVIFGGFSPAAIASRIDDANAKCVITADYGLRGSKTIPLKHNVDKALADNDCVESVLVVKHVGQDIQWQQQRDHWYHELVDAQASDCEPTWVEANHPLFILYTSGSTGTPKGISHRTGGYLLYATMTHHYVFDYHPDDIYWCGADVGWITGHSYLVYGPLANCATSVMFEGTPTYPTPARYWQVIDKHKVTIFYTAPTALRALRREGDDYVTQSDRSSLRLLGSVGEPINPDTWEWYQRVVGGNRCAIVDTWWQTETGGIILSPLLGQLEMTPGSVGKPLFGVAIDVVTPEGKPVATNETGLLVLKNPWPGLAQTVHGNHQRFIETYLTSFPGCYETGDEALCDEAGNYWIIGRVADELNVAGHRIGTAEVENSLVQHPGVAEAAVVGFPHEIKGQGIYAFITLQANQQGSETLKQSIKQHIADHLSPIAKPDVIQWANALPKTRSGKIMRRILRKIVTGNTDDLGDISTLADESVVAQLKADIIK